MIAKLFDSMIEWCNKPYSSLKSTLRVILTASLIGSLIVFVIVAYCFAWAEFTTFLTILHILLIVPVIVWVIKD
jgi:hypothetical protein